MTSKSKKSGKIKIKSQMHHYSNINGNEEKKTVMVDGDEHGMKIRTNDNGKTTQEYISLNELVDKLDRHDEDIFQRLNQDFFGDDIFDGTLLLSKMPIMRVPKPVKKDPREMQIFENAKKITGRKNRRRRVKTNKRKASSGKKKRKTLKKRKKNKKPASLFDVF